MAIGTKLGRLALRNWVRYKDIKPAPTASDLPTPTFTTTPLPRSYRGGLVTARANAQDITIAVGQARDFADSDNLLVVSAITKQIDADWAAGTGAGGFPDTALNIAVDTTYHIFIIGKADNSSLDAGFDTSITAANLLDGNTAGADGYTTYRRVGSIVTDPSANPEEILDYTQVGNQFILKASRLTDEDGNIDSTATSSTVKGCPLGFKVLADITAFVTDANGYLINISSLDAADEEASESAAPLVSLRNTGGAKTEGTFLVRTNTSAQIRLDSTEAMTTFKYALRSWFDDLGDYD